MYKVSKMAHLDGVRGMVKISKPLNNKQKNHYLIYIWVIDE